MGFLSSLFGGSENQQTSRSGFDLLPGDIQNAYTSFGKAVNNAIPLAQTAYTPMGKTADETAAFDAIRRGFAPNQQSLNQDISMLMNPYNDAVIGQLNREAQGQNSILKQNLNQAGQFGSNRQILGANDIENSRQGMIGSFLQNQYNQAIGQLFNNLIPQRQQDAQGLLGIGNFERGLSQQTASAPITGLQQIAQALGILPSNGGTVSSGTGTSNNGIFKPLSLGG